MFVLNMIVIICYNCCIVNILEFIHLGFFMSWEGKEARPGHSASKRGGAYLQPGRWGPVKPVVERRFITLENFLIWA